MQLSRWVPFVHSRFGNQQRTFRSQSVWLSICLLGGTCITVAVVVVISLIPTYVPERNPFEAEDGVAGKVNQYISRLPESLSAIGEHGAVVCQ